MESSRKKSKAKHNNFYITTPIYYTNGIFHLGHCYTTIVADAFARYRRDKGQNVFFLTGTDEHGQKVERAAQKEGLEPKQFVDKVVKNAKELWERLDISYDKFIRTSDSEHRKCVQKIFKYLYDKGDIYKAQYEGLYCTGCEAFYTKTQAIDGKYCPEKSCGKELEYTKEEGYFFRLSKYQEKIEQLFLDKKSFIAPDRTRNEMYKNFVKPGLEDLCVTRTSFSWGVPVSFDKKHVVYVWIDALANYLSALGYFSSDNSKMKQFWPANYQLVGKEIARFHTIIWPAFLIALDLPLPEKLYSHGWLLKGVQKMGKSLGNGFNPIVLSDRIGTDALRYYLLKEGPYEQDTPYSTHQLLNVVNKDLSNMLGNLLSRTSAMAIQNFGGEIICYDDFEPEQDDNILNEINTLYNDFSKAMDAFQPKKAIEYVLKLIDTGNKYIELCKPWELAKLQGEKSRLSTVLYILCEALRLSAIMFNCIMPKTSLKIFKALGIDADEKYAKMNKSARFVSNINYKLKKSEPLFPRLNIAEELKIIGD